MSELLLLQETRPFALAFALVAAALVLLVVGLLAMARARRVRRRDQGS